MKRTWPTMAQKAVIWDVTGYEPSATQLEAHKSLARIIMIVGGERAGKSKATAAEILACIPWCTEIALIGQSYSNTEKEFQYILEGLRLMGNIERKSIPVRGQQHIWCKSGAHIRTISVADGAEDLTATGESFDIVALVECGMLRHEIFYAARGRVAESRGRVLMSGTLLDNFGQMADLYRMFQSSNPYGGQVFALPSWSNLNIYPEGENDPEIKSLRDTLPADEFARRVAAKLVPSAAKIYPEFEPGLHVGDYPYDENYSVQIWVDVGFFPSSYAVLAIQEIAGIIYIIDEVYVQQQVHADVIEVCKQRPWWARTEGGVIDFAGRQHHAEKSAIEIWLELADLQLRSQQVGKLDGISRVRTFLIDPATGKPRIYFNTTCPYTITEFGTYKRKTDRKGNVLSDLPTNDPKTGHSLDAIAYGLWDMYGPVERKVRHPKTVRKNLWQRMVRG